MDDLPDDFGRQFPATDIDFIVACQNKAGFTIVDSVPVPARRFMNDLVLNGHTGGFVAQVELPMTYEAYKRVSSCTVMWSQPRQ